MGTEITWYMFKTYELEINNLHKEAGEVGRVTQCLTVSACINPLIPRRLQAIYLLQRRSQTFFPFHHDGAFPASQNASPSFRPDHGEPDSTILPEDCRAPDPRTRRGRASRLAQNRAQHREFSFHFPCLSIGTKSPKTFLLCICYRPPHFTTELSSEMFVWDEVTSS